MSLLILWRVNNVVYYDLVVVEVCQKYISLLIQWLVYNVVYNDLVVV